MWWGRELARAEHEQACQLCDQIHGGSWRTSIQRMANNVTSLGKACVEQRDLHSHCRRALQPPTCVSLARRSPARRSSLARRPSLLRGSSLVARWSRPRAWYSRPGQGLELRTRGLLRISRLKSRSSVWASRLEPAAWSGSAANVLPITTCVEPPCDLAMVTSIKAAERRRNDERPTSDLGTQRL